MGSFEGLNEFFSDNLVDLAKSLCYSEENILLLSGKIDDVKSKYPETYSNLVTCSHHADRRTLLEYAQDLISSWVYEDTVMKQLSKDRLVIKLDGADKERKILRNTRTNAQSDYLAEYFGHSVSLELMTDFTGYWIKNGSMDLRDAKYTKMENSHSLFLGISLKSREYFILDFTSNINARYINSHFPYGGKPAYKVLLDRNQFKKFSFDEIRNDLLVYINKRIG